MDLPEPVWLDLSLVDGNAFAIMGVWKQQARREGWTKEQIDHVIDDAKSSTYNHLVRTIQRNCDESA